MNITLEEKFTKKERYIAIKNAWITLGDELYDFAQNSKKIDEATKTKLSVEICREHARQEIVPVLTRFGTGNFNINFDETRAELLGKTVSSLTDSEYAKILKQAEEQEKLFDRLIAVANDDQPTV